MRKAILILAAGAAIGYYWGFNDAQIHKNDIVTRMVRHAGGTTRGEVANDADGMMKKVEQQ